MRYQRLIVVLVIATASSSLHAQSAYTCYSDDGRSSWSQSRPCTMPITHRNILYKCVSPSGSISIQQQPCAGKSKTVWLHDVAPEPAPSYQEEARQARERSQREQDARELARRAGTDQQQRYVVTYPASDHRSTQRAQCNQAKLDRESALKQAGLARTFDFLRQLDQAVYEACKDL